MLATLARNGSTVWSTRFLESLGATQLLELSRSVQPVIAAPSTHAKMAARTAEARVNPDRS